MKYLIFSVVGFYFFGRIFYGVLEVFMDFEEIGSMIVFFLVCWGEGYGSGGI